MQKPLALLLIILFCACSVSVEAGTGKDKLTETTESLVPYMETMQRNSAKLGYALEAKNVKLSDYYLKQLQLNIAEVVSRFELYQGHNIGKLVESHLKGPLGSLEKSLSEETFDEGTADTYRSLINRCNACHDFTGYGFIKLEPAHGRSEFNQLF